MGGEVRSAWDEIEVENIHGRDQSVRIGGVDLPGSVFVKVELIEGGRARVVFSCYPRSLTYRQVASPGAEASGDE